jgi:AcrR family transcriptional regulator
MEDKMAKAFSETEMELIRNKLIETCQVCWEKYGYKRTNVSEICEMSGISKGSFYAFFPSKEVLFVETANHFQEKLYAIMRHNKPENPNKSDLAKCLKLFADEFYNNKWLFSLRGDYEMFLRKLPEGYLEEGYRKDMLDIASMLEFYNMTPKVSIEELTAVIYTIVFSLYFTDTIGKHHRDAIYTLIDCSIERLIE